MKIDPPPSAVNINLQENIEKYGRFLACAFPWIVRGFNVIPARGLSKIPAVKFAKWHRPESPRIEKGVYKYWSEDSRYRNSNALILLGSGDFTVIDIDDMRQLRKVEKLFGMSSLYVRSGREGGGLHLYYRGAIDAPNSKKHKLQKVDFKSNGGYVVAPGSVHEKTGTVYYCSLDLWERHEECDFAKWAPEFRHEALDKIRIKGRKRKARGASSSRGQGTRQFPLVGTLEPTTPVVWADGTKSTIVAARDHGARIHVPGRRDATPSGGFFSGDFYDYTRGERWRIRQKIGDLFEGVSAVSVSASNCISTVSFSTGTGTENALRAITKIAQDEPLPQPRSAKSQIPQASELVSASKTKGRPPLLSAFKTAALRRHGDIEVVHTGSADLLALGKRAASPGTTLLVCGPVGSRKTALAAELWREAATAQYVSPEEALTHALQERLEGCAHYQASNAKNAPKVNTTLASFYKLGNALPDLFVLDEAVKNLADLGSSKTHIISHKVLTKRLLVHKLAHCERALAMSADFEFWHLRELVRQITESAPGRKIKIIVVDDHPLIRHNEVTSAADAKTTFLERCKPGETHVLASDQKRDLLSVAKKLAKEQPNLRIAAIHGDTSKRPLLHPAQFVRDHDVILITHAVGTGVSFEAAVDSVTVLHQQAIVPAQTMLQTAARFRNVNDRTLVWGVKNWKSREYVSDTSKIRKQFLAAAEISKELIGNLLPSGDLDDDGFMAIAVNVERDRLRSEAQPLQSLCDGFERYGWTCTGRDERPKEECTDLRGEEQEIVEDDVRNLSDAEPIDEHGYRERKKNYDRTQQDQHEMRRFEIEDFFGRIDEDLIMKDRRGKYRQRIQKFVYAKVCAEEPHLVAHLEDGEKHASQREHTYAKALLVRQLFEDVYGATWGDSATADAKTIRAKVAEFREKYATEVNLFLSRLTCEEKSVAWCNGILRKYGAGFSSKRPSAQGDRHYTAMWAPEEDWTAFDARLKRDYELHVVASMRFAA